MQFLLTLFYFAGKNHIGHDPQTNINHHQYRGIQERRQCHINRYIEKRHQYDGNHCPSLLYAEGQQLVMDMAFIGQKRITARLADGENTP